MVDNIPFVATMIPLIKFMAPGFDGAEGLMPLWWSLALGACLGGNGSLVGASTNLIVAGMAERAGRRIRFLPFRMLAFPIMLWSAASRKSSAVASMATCRSRTCQSVPRRSS